MRKVERIKKQCEVCQKELWVKSSQLKRGRGKYCSRACVARNSIAGWNKGKERWWSQPVIHHSEESRKKIGLASIGRWAGNKNPNWHGGIDTSLERNKLMKKLDYRIWRETVFARDNWTCIECGIRGGNLEADHIKPWSLFPELRYAIDNGRTLCTSCHRQTQTYGNKIFQIGGLT